MTSNWSTSDIPWLIFIAVTFATIAGRLSSGGGERYGLLAIILSIAGTLDFLGWHINTSGWGKGAVGPRLITGWLGEKRARGFFQALDACLLGSGMILVWL